MKTKIIAAAVSAALTCVGGAIAEVSEVIVAPQKIQTSPGRKYAIDRDGQIHYFTVGFYDYQSQGFEFTRDPFVIFYDGME